MTPLKHCSLPINISDIPIADAETSIFIRCHDRLFSNVTVLDEQNQELFIGTGPGPTKSWSWRRQLTDSSGTPIFELRHHGWAMKNLWTVVGPDGQQIAELKAVKHGSPGRYSNFDMIIANAKEGGEDVVLQIRQKDFSAITTQVFFTDTCIAEVLLQESNDSPYEKQADRSFWRARFAGGLDPAVILIIALCRAERHHTHAQ